MKKQNRGVQLLESGPAVQEGIQLLSHPNLHPVLHARYRVLGVLLAGSERRACPGVTRYKFRMFIVSLRDIFSPKREIREVAQYQS